MDDQTEKETVTEKETEKPAEKETVTEKETETVTEPADGGDGGEE